MNCLASNLENIAPTEPESVLLDSVAREAAEAFAGARGSHDWEHTLRVLGLCRQIGPREQADMVVLCAAAYLHDIGRAAQDRSNGGVCHAAKGAEMAAAILAPLDLEARRKENIIHCVRTHRFRGGQIPGTIEARVLFDADKLDAIGAVGVARAYLFAGELGARLHNPDLAPDQAAAYSKNDTGHREYVVKLSKIKGRIMTAEGRRLAEARHDSMVRFFERFLDEYSGRC
jgi:uncharacterized protein